MLINHNCCIKLVLFVIFIYDARSHTHITLYDVRTVMKSPNDAFLGTYFHR